MSIQINCSDFQKNADGSWTPRKHVDLGNGIQVGPGMFFRKGVLFNGVDLAEQLDTHCSL